MANDQAEQQQVIRIRRKEAPEGVVCLPPNARRVLIHVEPGAQAAVMGVCGGENGVLSEVEVVLEQDARLELLRTAAAVSGSETSLNVRQARGSSLRAFFLTKGGHAPVDHIAVLLEGEGAEAFLNGLHYLAGDAEITSRVFVDHAAPSTTSNQLYKSILRDKSRSVFNGRIMVRREAQLTNAYQLNKNLLLSPEARVDTKPELEIFADDVKCTHGATIGRMDDEQLFYCQARGIDKATAREMLVNGFVEDVLSQIRHPDLRAAAAL